MDAKDIQLIIPCAGIGKRFIDAGYKQHKSLIEVDNAPIIKHVVNSFPGVEDISFICNGDSKSEMYPVLAQVTSTSKIFSIRTHKKGPVYSVSQIFDKIDDNRPVIISYCDCFSYFDFNKFLEEIEGFDGAVLANVGFHPVMLGGDNYAACFHKDNILLEIKEKEPVSDRFAIPMSVGVYYFKRGEYVKKYFKRLIESNIHINNEFYVSLVYNLMIKDGLKNKVCYVENIANLGTPNDLEEYRNWSNYFWGLKKPRSKYGHDQNVTLIVPMAGRGSRMNNSLPKPLIDMGEIPMFAKAVYAAPWVKNKVFIVLQEHIDKFQIDRIIKLYFKEAKIIAVKAVTEGQACTCELAIKDLDPDKPILIHACDAGFTYNAEKYARLVNEGNEDAVAVLKDEDTKNSDVIIFSFRHNQCSRILSKSFSWLEVDENNWLKKCHVKEFPFKNPLKEHAIIGTMFFRKVRYFLDALNANYKENKRTNGEFYVDDLLNQNIQAGLNVKVFECDNYLCWGDENNLKVYNYYKDYFKKKFVLEEQFV